MIEDLNFIYRKIGENVQQYGWVKFIENSKKENSIRIEQVFEHRVEIVNGIVHQLWITGIPKAFFKALDNNKEYVLEYSLKMINKFGKISPLREVAIRSESYQIIEAIGGRCDILIPLYDIHDNGMKDFIIIEKERGIE